MELTDDILGLVTGEILCLVHTRWRQSWMLSICAMPIWVTILSPWNLRIGLQEYFFFLLCSNVIINHEVGILILFGIVLFYQLLNAVFVCALQIWATLPLLWNLHS